MIGLGNGLRRRARELVADSWINRLACRLIQRGVDGSDPVVIGDRYELTTVIGSGSHSIVFAAYDCIVEREVALKVFGRGIERAMDEARALARVNHPNVVTLYDVARSKGFLYLVMELILGWTLTQRIQMGLDWRSAVELFIAAGRGLAAAHQAGVVHGDVKPANIMVGHDGSVRVVDFELSRRLGSSDARPAGTRKYLAPECWAGAGASPYSDQFSFCVALWEALYGARPGEPAVLSKTPEQERLEHALRRGLAAKPEDRHCDMVALIDELEDALRWGTV